jgi:hypothetical protein
MSPKTMTLALFLALTVLTFSDIGPAFSLQAHVENLSTVNDSLKPSMPHPLLTASDGSRSYWTILTMAPDGAWGTATEIDTNVAIKNAIANCKKMHKERIGCGYMLTAIQGGWSLAIRCGSENIIVAQRTLADAEKAALNREIELREAYRRDMPACRRLAIVDPHGKIVSEKRNIVRRQPVLKPLHH